MKSDTSKPGKAAGKASSKAPAKRAAKAKGAGQDVQLLDAETRRTQRRVATLRDKIRHALDDPEKRKQMVDAIRFMMRDDT